MPSDNVDEANRLNKENEHHYIVFERMTDWGLPNKHLRADVDPSTVCQYTGLTDKNGRKIFEGDCLGRKENVIEYLCGTFCVSGDRSLSMMAKYNEVIGNIFDKE